MSAAKSLPGKVDPTRNPGQRSRSAHGQAGPSTRAAPTGLMKRPGKPSKAPPEITYVSSSSEPEPEDADDEDDFEEVPIPSAIAGPSTPAGPGTSAPGTPMSRATNLTAGTTPGDLTAESGAEGYEGYEDEESEEEGDGVIRVEIGGETPEEKAKRIALAMRKKPMTSKDRALRLDAHKIHLVALIANARLRNTWANNLLLRCRLLSLLPHPLVTGFNIPPSRFPDRAQRSRLFFDALQSLVTWWSQSYFDIPDGNIGVRTRPWDEVQAVIDKLPRLTRSDLLSESTLGPRAGPSNGKQPGHVLSPEDQKLIDAKLDSVSAGANGERLRTVNSLMKRALLQDGSRDASAVLFVALCRSCGLGARLVVSLQAVPWRAEKVAVKKMSGETKGGRTVASRQGNGEADEEDEDSMEEVPIPDPAQEEGGPGAVMDKIRGRRGKGIRQAGKRRQQDPADVYRLRKAKPPPPPAEGSTPKKPKMKLDLSSQPPVMWAEVFSRSDQRWIPVDPIRGTIRKKTHFEPASDNGPVRMAYVLAFEEDGYAREVTLRYTKSFGAKTSKLRVPPRKDEPDWWEGILGMLARPYRLNRDDLEDAELETSQVSEAMPMHLNGFKDHPIYVLERHLKREEVIQPKREVGKFRGEPVYRRAHVHACRTAENWMRSGRKVKDRQDPLKWVKQRAMTINRRREVEAARLSGEEQMQGLYAEWQTEVWRPPPIKDGKIPQNAFGNIDLYAPTMLPPGAAHLPYKGIAKVARQLGISYAEACTGFEFKKQRAIPTITGIVVAQEQVEMVMAAFKESAAAAEERERRKREEAALKRWAKLINGLRVRERLREQYGGAEGLHDASHNPLADPTEAPVRKLNAANILASAHKEAGKKWDERARSASEETDGAGNVAKGDSVKQEPGVENGDAEDDEDMEEVAVPVDPTVDSAAPASVGAHESPSEDLTESEPDDEIDAVFSAPRQEPQKRASRSQEAAGHVRISIPARRGAAVAPVKAAARTSARPKPAGAAQGTPSRVLPRREARPAGKVMVDNPYEESSEDEEKGFLQSEEEEEEGEEEGEEEHGGQEGMAEIGQGDDDAGGNKAADHGSVSDEAALEHAVREEPIAVAAPIRKLRLRVGSGRPPAAPAISGGRVTRSKRKR